MSSPALEKVPSRAQFALPFRASCPPNNKCEREGPDAAVTDKGCLISKQRPWRRRRVSSTPLHSRPAGGSPSFPLPLTIPLREVRTFSSLRFRTLPCLLCPAPRKSEFGGKRTPSERREKHPASVCGSYWLICRISVQGRTKKGGCLGCFLGRCPDCRCLRRCLNVW